MAMQFTPIKSFVDSSFFNKLGQYKLEEAKLAEESVPIRGVMSHPIQRNKFPALTLSADSFGRRKQHAGDRIHDYLVSGEVLNFNTLESFKEFDKLRYLKEVAGSIWSQIESGEALITPGVLVQFRVITFSDLKKYKYYYWFCFPSLPFQARILSVYDAEEDDRALDAAIERHQAAADDSGLFFVIEHNSESSHHHHTWTVHHLRDLPKHESHVRVGLVDLGSRDGLPWHLRNLCALLKFYKFTTAMIYVWRYKLGGRWIEVDLTPGNVGELDGVAGWERNSQNKMIPKLTDLSALNDPLTLADQAVDLNLKLMKWRAAPDIDLDSIKNAKCLLLGAGTLGCYVSRGLLAWGVRHITLVDNGRVSYSNPVRQPLFTLEDSRLERPKAEAAAAALKAIFPGVDAKAHNLEIPMAGHPVHDEEHQKQDYDQLCALIDAHDVVFLLMDSRESRWLPTVIAQAKEKLVMNVAIGFDSFLVMRHGVQGQEQKLGCYFCNDVVAPIDSVSRLSLDQMCTVTRPGVAMLAASQAVELFATIMQDKRQGRAPNDAETVLGKICHQLRGFLVSHDTLDIWSPAFKNCSACSNIITSTWNQDGWEFVKSALNDSTYLTELSGLGDLQRETSELEFESDGGLE